MIHRDIKPENVLIDSRGHLLLGDFGLSYTTDAPDVNVLGIVLHETAGTPGYWAPEIVTVTPTHGYGWEIDIWSLGLVIFEMTVGRTVPFYDAQDQAESKRRMMLYDVPLFTVQDDLLRHMLAQVCRRTSRPLKHSLIICIDACSRPPKSVVCSRLERTRIFRDH